MKLSEVEVGSTVRVKSVKNRRLQEMGFVKGTIVKVLRKAPLGEPIEFEVRGYKISLRKNEADNIEVDAA